MDDLNWLLRIGRRYYYTSHSRRIGTVGNSYEEEIRKEKKTKNIYNAYDTYDIKHMHPLIRPRPDHGNIKIITPYFCGHYFTFFCIYFFFLRFDYIFILQGTDEVRCHRGATQYHNILLMPLIYKLLLCLDSVKWNKWKR